LSREIPIVVQLAEEAGLATLLHTSALDSISNIKAFALLSQSCTPQILEEGVIEILARAIHEEYVRDQYSDPNSPPEFNENLLPWEKLKEDSKESNRNHAEHMVARLRKFGYEIIPLVDWETEDYTFLPEEVEQMARMEHKRWCQERTRAGYKFTEGQKDLEKKLHPDLRPWHELNEVKKEMDYNFIRKTPRILAKAGFQIRKLSRQ
jgi:hypothetical protein